jgi:hypothetical protein
MDAETYRKWQELHRRMAQGDTLNASEQAAYEAGCRELDADEKLDGSLEQIRQLREQILFAETEQQFLREQEAELDARIAALETRMDTRTRQLLGIGN